MSEGSRSEKEMSVMELRSELQNNDADGEQEEEEESIIAHLNLSEEVLDEYREAFAVFDKEGEGVITRKILTSTMQSLGQNPTEAEIQDMIKDVDVDGNGEVDFEEFVLMLHRRMTEKIDPKEELKDIFAILDRDSNGLVSRHELKYMMTQLGVPLTDKDVDVLMNDIDIDKDGHMSFDDFMNYMKTKGIMEN
ncbi:neo-calmodulin-like [Convolutriloba macropyga]|uniref:neo-calmodulin-like n=1 Tax=Convolutriloba macropyga TaxID=536237 RepID=UPI003F51C4DC